MSYARLPADFSTSALVASVEQRFGLLGFARLVKLLELLAASPEQAAGRICLPVSDYLEALQCGRADLDGLLIWLEAAAFLTVTQDQAPGAPLVVVLAIPGPYVPGSADPRLFRRPNEWATWCAVELAFPPTVTADPHTQQLFRRWCATNVTTDEMAKAAQLAIAAENSLSPSALHSALARQREQRIEHARR